MHPSTSPGTCRRSGLSPLFVSRVGNDDRRTRASSAAMHDWGMDSAGLQHGFRASYRHGARSALSSDGEPAYDIVAERAYDFIEPRSPARRSRPAH